jgi:hypothetical protein
MALLLAPLAHIHYRVRGIRNHFWCFLTWTLYIKPLVLLTFSVYFCFNGHNSKYTYIKFSVFLSASLTCLRFLHWHWHRSRRCWRISATMYVASVTVFDAFWRGPSISSARPSRLLCIFCFNGHNSKYTYVKFIAFLSASLTCLRFPHWQWHRSRRCWRISAAVYVAFVTTFDAFWRGPSSCLHLISSSYDWSRVCFLSCNPYPCLRLIYPLSIPSPPDLHSIYTVPDLDLFSVYITLTPDLYSATSSLPQLIPIVYPVYQAMLRC